MSTGGTKLGARAAGDLRNAEVDQREQDHRGDLWHEKRAHRDQDRHDQIERCLQSSLPVLRAPWVR